MFTIMSEIINVTVDELHRIMESEAVNRTDLWINR